MSVRFTRGRKPSLHRVLPRFTPAPTTFGLAQALATVLSRTITVYKTFTNDDGMEVCAQVAAKRTCWHAALLTPTLPSSFQEVSVVTFRAVLATNSVPMQLVNEGNHYRPIVR